MSEEQLGVLRGLLRQLPDAVSTDIRGSSQWTIRMIDGLPYFIAPRWVDPSQTPQRNTVHHPDGRAA